MASQIGAADDEERATMDRTALMDFVVPSRVDRKEAEEMAASRKKSERSDTVRELEIQLELKNREMETEKIHIELETKKMESRYGNRTEKDGSRFGNEKDGIRNEYGSGEYRG